MVSTVTSPLRGVSTGAALVRGTCAVLTIRTELHDFGNALVYPEP